MRHLFVLGAVVCGLAACGPHGNQPVSSASPAPAKPGISAEARARAFLQQQIDAAGAHAHGALQATFVKDAIVFTPGARPPESASFFGIGDTGFDGVTTTKTTIAKLVADGTADAVWFYAEVATENEGPIDGAVAKGQGLTRVVELIVASESWRAVAASFTSPREPQPSGANTEVPGATANGPLAKLAATPGALAAQLAPNAIVVGPTKKQLALGSPGARDALAAWQLAPLSLYQRAREIRTATWGFVQANLDRPTPDKLVERLSVQLFAVPTAEGNWRVVLAQFLAQ